MKATRHFCLIITDEGSVRFAILRKMHGFLIDRRRKKAYAIVKDAVPTSWTGKFARCYLLDEHHSQSTHFDSSAPAGVFMFADSLRMEKRVTPTPDAPQAVLELTSDVLYDMVDGRLVRSLEHRRPTVPFAIMIASLGGAVALVLVSLAKIWIPT